MARHRLGAQRVAHGTVLALVALVTVVATPAAATPGVGRAKPSVVEGLPVPAEARLVFHRTTAADDLVLGPLGVIDAWYGGRLPAGRGWRSSAVCDPGHLVRALFPAKGFHRLWVRGKDALELSTSDQHPDLDQVRILVNQFRFGSGGSAVQPALLCRPRRR